MRMGSPSITAKTATPLSRDSELSDVHLVSPSGHGVTSFPNWVLYSHAGPVGTAEDLSSQMTKSSDHVKDQVIRITCKVT